MHIEETIFKKAVLNKSSLIKYGFKKINNNYIYETNILDNKFKVEVEITNEKVKGKIIDLSINEEYTSFRIKDMNGDFVSKIKSEFENVLINIKENCFIENIFVSNQANRIAKYISDTYKDKPEFLWPKYPEDCIYRNKINNKWYALMMRINESKIREGNDDIDVLNIKLNQELIQKLLNTKGFYKAYHMNKKYWITISLDESIKDKDIIKYIDESYNNSI